MNATRTCLGMMLGLAVVPAIADTCYSGSSSGNSDAGVTTVNGVGALYFSTPQNVPVYWGLNGTPQSLGGNTTSEFSALGNTAYVRGGNRELWEVSNTGVWTSLGGDITWNPAAVVLNLPDSSTAHRMVFYRGTNREVWYRERSNGSWGPHTSLGGVATSSPQAVAWNNDGHVAVFERGQANDIWYRERIGGVWSAWNSIGGPVSSVDPAVVTHGIGTYTVFARSGTTIIMNKYNGVWSGWVGGIGGPPPGAWSEPAAIALAGGGYVIFVRGNTESYPGRQMKLVYKNTSMDGVTWSGWTPIMAHSHESANNPEAVAYPGGYLVAAADVTNGYGAMTYCYGVP